MLLFKNKIIAEKTVQATSTIIDIVDETFGFASGIRVSLLETLEKGYYGFGYMDRWIFVSSLIDFDMVTDKIREEFQNKKSYIDVIKTMGDEFIRLINKDASSFVYYKCAEDPEKNEYARQIIQEFYDKRPQPIWLGSQMLMSIFSGQYSNDPSFLNEIEEFYRGLDDELADGEFNKENMHVVYNMLSFFDCIYKLDECRSFQRILEMPNLPELADKFSSQGFDGHLIKIIKYLIMTENRALYEKQKTSIKQILLRHIESDIDRQNMTPLLLYMILFPDKDSLIKLPMTEINKGVKKLAEDFKRYLKLAEINLTDDKKMSKKLKKVLHVYDDHKREVIQAFKQGYEYLDLQSIKNSIEILDSNDILDTFVLSLEVRSLLYRSVKILDETIPYDQLCADFFEVFQARQGAFETKNEFFPIEKMSYPTFFPIMKIAKDLMAKDHVLFYVSLLENNQDNFPKLVKVMSQYGKADVFGAGEFDNMNQQVFAKLLLEFDSNLSKIKFLLESFCELPYITRLANINTLLTKSFNRFISYYKDIELPVIDVVKLYFEYGDKNQIMNVLRQKLLKFKSMDHITNQHYAKLISLMQAGIIEKDIARTINDKSKEDDFLLLYIINKDRPWTTKDLPLIENILDAYDKLTKVSDINDLPFHTKALFVGYLDSVESDFISNSLNEYRQDILSQKDILLEEIHWEEVCKQIEFENEKIRNEEGQALSIREAVKTTELERIELAKAAFEKKIFILHSLLMEDIKKVSEIEDFDKRIHEIDCKISESPENMRLYRDKLGVLRELKEYYEEKALAIEIFVDEYSVTITSLTGSSYNSVALNHHEERWYRESLNIQTSIDSYLYKISKKWEKQADKYQKGIEKVESFLSSLGSKSENVRVAKIDKASSASVRKAFEFLVPRENHFELVLSPDDIQNTALELFSSDRISTNLTVYFNEFELAMRLDKFGNVMVLVDNRFKYIADNSEIIKNLNMIVKEYVDTFANEKPVSSAKAKFHTRDDDKTKLKIGAHFIKTYSEKYNTTIVVDGKVITDELQQRLIFKRFKYFLATVDPADGTTEISPNTKLEAETYINSYERAKDDGQDIPIGLSREEYEQVDAYRNAQKFTKLVRPVLVKGSLKGIPSEPRADVIVNYISQVWFNEDQKVTKQDVFDVLDRLHEVSRKIKMNKAVTQEDLEFRDRLDFLFVDQESTIEYMGKMIYVSLQQSGFVGDKSGDVVRRNNTYLAAYMRLDPIPPNADEQISLN